YIVFQTTLNIDILANAPVSNGIDISEQSATSYLIDPNDPDNEDLNTVVPDSTIVEWNIIKRKGDNDTKERPFYSTENINLSIYSDGIYSVIRDGTSRNVFFGPANDATIPYEQYEINATINYNEQTRQARQFVEIKGKEPFLLNEKFLMEFDKSQNGNGGSRKANNLWANGIDYLKLLISRDPNSSITRFSDCFRECISSSRLDLLELSSEQIVEVTCNNDDMEFLWGNVSEFLDPYTNEWGLFFQGKLNKDYFISKGSASVQKNLK
ncbi:unnamed protein product, partial [marine sediment metagenome]